MRVIANRDCYFSDFSTRELLSEKAIYEGSVYTVIGKKFRPGPIKFKDDPNFYPHGVWFYELLEQTGFHVSTLFTELPNEDGDTEIEKQELVINK